MARKQRSTCSAPRCRSDVPDSKAVFCVEHWLMVPMPVRERIAFANPRSVARLQAVSVACAVIELEERERDSVFETSA